MRPPRVQVYQARDGWRWRLLAGNNRIIAEGGEAYTRRRDAYRALSTVMAAMADVLEASEEDDDFPLVSIATAAPAHGNC